MIAIEQRDPLDELDRENETLQRLLERLSELATALRGGTRVPDGEIAEGLRLLGQYRAVHARRVDHDLGPVARRYAMPNCEEHLHAIEVDHDEYPGRIAQAERALEGHVPGDTESSRRLADLLDELAEAEHVALRYEGDYPLSCLRAALPDEDATSVLKAFESSASDLSDLDRHVAGYLSRAPGEAGRPVLVQCHATGCRAVAQATTFPSENGFLGLRPPDGWQAVSHRPRYDGGVVRIDVDFLCPEHRDTAPSSVPARQSLVGTGYPADAGPKRSAATVPPCCTPVPEIPS